MGAKTSRAFLAILGGPEAAVTAEHYSRTTEKKREKIQAKLAADKKSASEARLAALGAQQSATAIKGQGGDGSLLTGAGGTADPALTGKKTLLGAR